MNLTAIKYSKVSPAFLTANSTSHTWPFSAIAELIDNAYDPDVNASQINIEIRTIQNEKCLVFIDNGAGMVPEILYKMLSFGFSDKPEIKGHLPIGHYGNGFKSGSMRLGKDAIVFTVRHHIASVGLLSQSYLKALDVETVLVPIVSWKLPEFRIVTQPNNEHRENLDHIVKYSIFKSAQVLKAEIEEIRSAGMSGTKIVIYNLKRDSRGVYELDTLSTPDDILNPESVMLDRTNMIRPVAEIIPTYRKSLRTYCSILYLKPRLKIYLRGQKVKTKLTAKSLLQTEYDSYKPGWLNLPVKIILGVSQSNNKEDYGSMLYHRNRLIKAYEKVGYQKQMNGLGEGVVAVVEVNFLQPIHNKQDFLKDEKHNAFMHQLSQKMNLYYNVKTDSCETASNVPIKTPWNWAQCESCLKWRRLIDYVDHQNLPAKWYCYMNEDATHNRCDIEEEAEDEDDVLLNRESYSKKYKQQQQDLKRRITEEQNRQKQHREMELTQREVAVTQREQGVGKINLVKARKALDLARKKDRQQSELINRLQQEKIDLENQKRDMLNIAENFAMKSLAQQEKGTRTATPPTPSTSTQSRKRKSKPNQNAETDSQAMCIKTEDGGFFMITQNETSDESPVIDLTIDDDSQETDRRKKRKKDRLSRQDRSLSAVDMESPVPTGRTLDLPHDTSPVPSHDLSPVPVRRTRDPSEPVTYNGLITNQHTEKDKSGDQLVKKDGSRPQSKTVNSEAAKESRTEASSTKSRVSASVVKSGSKQKDKIVVKIFGKKPGPVAVDEIKEEVLDMESDVHENAIDGGVVRGGDSGVSSGGDVARDEENSVVNNDVDVNLNGDRRDKEKEKDKQSEGSRPIDKNADSVNVNTANISEGSSSKDKDIPSQVKNKTKTIAVTKPQSSKPHTSKSKTDFSCQTDDVLSEAETNLQKRVDDLLEEMQSKNETLEDLQNNLSSLRTDVIKLINIIVPDLSIDNVEKVDDFVKEIIRVNNVSGDVGAINGEMVDETVNCKNRDVYSGNNNKSPVTNEITENNNGEPMEQEKESCNSGVQFGKKSKKLSKNCENESESSLDGNTVSSELTFTSEAETMQSSVELQNSEKASDVGEKPSDVGEKPSEVGEKLTNTGEKPSDSGGKASNVGEKPSDTREKPSDIVEKLSCVGEKPSDVGEKPPDVSEKPSNIGEKPSDVGEKLSDVSEKPSDIGEKLSDVGEKPPDVTEKPSDIGEKPDVGEKLSDVSEKLSDIGEKLSDVGEKLLDVSEKPSDMGEKPPDVTEKPSEIGEKPSDVGEKLSDVSEKPSDMGEKPSDVSDKPSDMGEKPSDVGEKLSDVGEKLSDVCEKPSEKPSDVGETSDETQEPIENSEVYEDAFLTDDLNSEKPTQKLEIPVNNIEKNVNNSDDKLSRILVNGENVSNPLNMSENPSSNVNTLKISADKNLMGEISEITEDRNTSKPTEISLANQTVEMSFPNEIPSTLVNDHVSITETLNSDTQNTQDFDDVLSQMTPCPIILNDYEDLYD